jgi:hypothetical protein
VNKNNGFTSRCEARNMPKTEEDSSITPLQGSTLSRTAKTGEGNNASE